MSALTLRRTRQALVAGVVLLLVWLLYSARGALVPFLLGGLLAYMLAPLVELFVRLHPFHRRHEGRARTLAVLEVYLLGAGALGLAGVLIIPALVAQTTDFIDNIPNYVERARDQFDRWNATYQQRVPAEVRDRIEEQAQTVGDNLGAVGRNMFNRTLGLVTSTFSIVLGYLVIPFWLFYVLKDRHQLGPAIQNWFPPGLREDVDNCIEIWRKVLGSYIRAQLTLGLFIGVITTLGLFLLGIDFYVILGITAGITELIPVIGPILGAVPAIIVTLALEPDKTLWVVLFYFAVQQIENAILVPRIQGNAVNLHPALIIVLLVVAQQLAGFFGMLIAVPLAAVSKDLFLYIYRRLREREEELQQLRVAPARIGLPPRSPDQIRDDVLDNAFRDPIEAGAADNAVASPKPPAVTPGRPNRRRGKR